MLATTLVLTSGSILPKDLKYEDKNMWSASEPSELRLSDRVHVILDTTTLSTARLLLPGGGACGENGRGGGAKAVLFYCFRA